ncbi:MAG: response regulator [Crocinitomix sp.]|nr:response regulator [Crocinitomix sp.]
MKKILIIEDNVFLRENTAELLQLAEYEVLIAKNGKVGIEMARTENPDLIICDIMMPNLDGYGVLSILNKNPKTACIPFVFLTAKSEKSDFRKGMNLGADDYIVKPFAESDLFEVIETRLKRRVVLNKGLDKVEKHSNSLLQEAKRLSELENLPKDRKEKAFEIKEEIYREDDHANYLYFVMSGEVKCVKTDSHGKHFITQIYSKGDYFGYMSILEGDDCKSTAIAMKDTRVAIIPKHDFLLLIQKNQEVAAKFIKMLSGNVAERENRLLQLAYSPVGERVASTILSLINNDPETNSETPCINISREDLANIVGTAKESLIRALSELKKAGIIDIKGYDICVLNLERLKANANGFLML